MKKITLLTLLTVLLTGYSYGQCTRTGTFTSMGNPNTTTYPISGSMTMTYILGGTKEVSFNGDFNSVQGFDLRLYLSTTALLSDAGNQNIELTNGVPLLDDNGGDTTGANLTGNPMSPLAIRTFTIPAQVKIDDYDYVIIQCVQFGVPWGQVNFGAVVGSDCMAVLGTEDRTFENLRIFPNPVHDVLTMEGIQGNIEKVTVYDAIGKLVTFTNDVLNNTLDVSNLYSGLYFAVIESNNQKTTRKFFVE